MPNIDIDNNNPAPTPVPVPVDIAQLRRTVTTVLAFVEPMAKLTKTDIDDKAVAIIKQLVEKEWFWTLLPVLLQFLPANPSQADLLHAFKKVLSFV